MKVILLEDIVGAGGAGEVVEVKNGYARNKLLPSGVAIEATKTNMKTLEHRRAKIAAKKAVDKEMAREFADKIEGKQIDFTAKAGESGKLFGSVTAQDITDKIQEALGFEIDRRKLLLDAPLKEIGVHDVKYRVYPEVEAVIKVNVMSDGAPVLPPVETLKDTYSDEALEDEDGETGYYANRASADAEAQTEAAPEPEEQDEAASDDTEQDA